MENDYNLRMMMKEKSEVVFDYKKKEEVIKALKLILKNTQVTLNLFFIDNDEEIFSNKDVKKELRECLKRNVKVTVFYSYQQENVLNLFSGFENIEFISCGSLFQKNIYLGDSEKYINKNEDKYIISFNSKLGLSLKKMFDMYIRNIK